jgi:hypothetical protein
MLGGLIIGDVVLLGRTSVKGALKLIGATVYILGVLFGVLFGILMEYSILKIFNVDNNGIFNSKYHQFSLKNF